MKCARKECPNINYTHTQYCEKHAQIWRREQGRVYVPISPIKAHVEGLRGAGLGWGQISRLSGCSVRFVRNVMESNQSYVMKFNAEKILSVPVPKAQHTLASKGATVCNVGTQRRLQALISMGYTNKQLAKECGYPLTQFRYLLEKGNGVTGGVARRVDEVFRRLHVLPPPKGTAAKRSRLRAQKKGWPPPFAWDLETIDNPDAKPDLGGKSDFLDYIYDARSLGHSEKRMAEFLGMQTESLRQRIRREVA